MVKELYLKVFLSPYAYAFRSTYNMYGSAELALLYGAGDLVVTEELVRWLERYLIR